MNLYEKLHAMQERVTKIVKDGTNQSDKYDFASNANVVEEFRPIMDELKLLLIPRVENAILHEGATRSGTARFMTELFMTMVWHDVESGEELPVPWYAQGVDLAGEKGVGKGQTYAEKYFLLKFFHVPTQKDDPDGDGRTRGGEKPQKGTAAAKETEDYQRAACAQMLSELYGGDAEKIKAALIAATKSDARGFPGVDSLERVSAAALPVVYKKLKKAYETRIGAFELKEEPGDAAD